MNPWDEPLHGGGRHALARELGQPVQDLLDFSANLNPLGPPAGVLELLGRAHPEWIAAYPDEAAPRLRALLCARHGAPDACLVLGSGGASLLFLALRALAPRRVILPRPCFREQPRAVAACGAQEVPWLLKDLRMDLDALRPGEGEALVLTNPHNPTGQLLARDELMDWIVRHPAVPLVLDEAFMDYAPEHSLVPELLARPRTVILRSLTKFHAMPGMRVGYAFADAATAARMGELQEAWPVGQLELLAAQRALEDGAYAARSLDAFARDLPAFRAQLRGLGLDPLPGHAPFALVPVPVPGTLLARDLAREGLLIRTCAQWPGLGDAYIRLGLRGASDRLRLVRALEVALDKALDKAGKKDRHLRMPGIRNDADA